MCSGWALPQLGSAVAGAHSERGCLGRTETGFRSQLAAVLAAPTALKQGCSGLYHWPIRSGCWLLP